MTDSSTSVAVTNETFNPELVGFVLVGVLLLTLTLMIVIHLFPRLHFLSESIISLTVGISIGLVCLVLYHFGIDFIFNSRSFAHIFQSIFLPCIIFNAGFTMKKRNFFANIVPILTYAIGGCVLSSLIIGFGIYGYTFINVKFIGLGSQNLSINQALQFGTLLGATDPVATLALFLELNVDPLLYSLVFGESVLNDAVSIVLYHTLDKDMSTFGWMDMLSICGEFLIKALGSCAIGLFISYISAFLFNKMKTLNISATLNVILIVGTAFFGYFLSEILELSGILTIFVTGAVMSHHHWYSVPENQRHTVYNSVGTLAFISDTMTFICVGITLSNPKNLTLECWNPLFIVYVLLLCFISRAFNIFPITFIMNCRKNAPHISWKHQLMLWYAGLRGAIAILLSLTMGSVLVINTTYSIVLFTNVLIGMTTPPLLKLFKIQMGGSEPLNIREADALEVLDLDDPQSNNSNRALKKMFIMFDEGFMKKWFGGQTRQEKELATIDPYLTQDDVQTNREKVDHMFNTPQPKENESTEIPMTTEAVEQNEGELGPKSSEENTRDPLINIDTPPQPKTDVPKMLE
ncbi:sodium/hydrogen exchanger, putative [Entamoeba invadens IP1]|uniref:Sodium/hydrogen exchanger n=1 Tax=Entamoeba invadens IP1 TaxID=370355 RepID=L7FM01_ENTIV|nr:sodium/hydrogen exchanger, putative [Entamoeba invadens IP1]ELP87625.1 sodium/hydrogen exchanger, putative [Entamoeba invadens IP1]|eukprot:XP_004254396.1 sodium/hydrogen exchanger, putative [Entamoeba invadens IP1]